MHSPPVQPISSSRSGTGSVITMCEEVSVSRDRRPGTEASQPPAASTAAPARTRPPVASTTTADPSRATRSTGVRSRIATPRSSSRARSPRPSRAGCTVAAPG